MTDAKMVRFAAVLVVLCGYVFVFRAGEGRIGERLAANAETVERLGVAERTLARGAALDAERARLERALESDQRHDDRSALTARFLRDAAALATARRTTITAIAASGSQTASATPPRSLSSSSSASASAPDETFDTIALDVTVEGRYTDVLATIRALSSGRALAAVELESIARKDTAAAEALLTASLHVVLQRIVSGSSTEVRVVGARPV